MPGPPTPEAPPIRVLVVDDDDLVRIALRRYLSIADDIELVAECASGDDAVTYVSEHPVDVILMDVHMPGTDGVAATERILRLHPRVRVVVLTSYDEDESVRRALAAGASGYLLKSIVPEALVDVVRGVHRGVVVMSDSPLSRLQSRRPERPATEIPDLNEREREILSLLCAGLSNAEIGQQLYMSESSVKGWLTGVMRKLGVTTRLKAVVLAHELGLDRC